MEEISHFITDQQYSIALKRSANSLMDTVLAESILELWPSISPTKEPTLEQFAEFMHFKNIVKCPIGRAFLFNQMRIDGKDISFTTIKLLEKLASIILAYQNRRHRTLQVVERTLKKIKSVTSALAFFKEHGQRLNEKYEKLVADIEAEQLKSNNHQPLGSPSSLEQQSSTANLLQRIASVHSMDETDSMDFVQDMFAYRFEVFFDEMFVDLQTLIQPHYITLRSNDVCVKRYRDAYIYAYLKDIELQDFVIFRHLGRGAFGVVSGACHRVTGQMVALKALDRKAIKSRKMLKLVRGEFEILKKLGENSSPYCVSLKYAFMTPKEMYLGLPLCTGGDLLFHMHQAQKGYDLDLARFFAAEVLLGIEHLHSLGIIYRDLKPENILLTEKGHAVISDMGLAVMCPFTPFTRGNKMLKGKAGTPGYWSPEIIRGEGYAFECDWWGFGVVLFELIVGECPFTERRTRMRNRNEGTLQYDILYPSIDREGNPFPEDAQDLISRLLERNRKKRLGISAGVAEDMKTHPFFFGIDWMKMELNEANAPWAPPDNKINAMSQRTIAKQKKKDNEFKRIVLTEEDEIPGFNFRSPVHWGDIANVVRLEQNGSLDHLKAKTGSKACVIC